MFVVLLFGISCQRLGAQSGNCGDPLSPSAQYRGVLALSNSGGQTDALGSCKQDRTYKPCEKNQQEGTNGCIYGLRYECVEFVKRFYSLRNDTVNQLDTSAWKIPSPGDAKNYIILGTNGQPPTPGSSGLAVALVAFANDGTSLVAVDDILVFDELGAKEQSYNTGHVAIVTAVDLAAMTVTVIEQNFSIQGTATLNLVPNLIRSSPYPIIDVRRNKTGPVTFPVKGWLRSKTAVSTPVPTEPTPVMGTLTTNPSPPVAGIFSISIVNGADFDTQLAQLYFTGPGCPDDGKTCVVPNVDLQVTATTLAGPANITVPGPYSVFVQNGSGGPKSAPAPITLEAASANPNPVPALQNLNPSTVVVANTSQTIMISGTGFIPSSTMTYNGIPHTVTYVNASTLTFQTTYADVANAGSYPVVIANPGPGGGPSGSKYLSVTASPTNTTPVIQNLYTQPTPTDAGTFTTYIKTQNVDPSDVEVYFVGPSCSAGTSTTPPPCLISTNQITDNNGLLSLPTQINNGGSFMVYVRNGSAGTPSNSGTLPVTGVPTITIITTSVNPPRVGTFNMNVTGTNFDPATVNVYLLGPACSKASSCPIPFNHLNSVTSSSFIAPTQINNSGQFTVYVQNGPQGIPSAGYPLPVQ
jgi:hypothetical protein